ncbi:hypothetical protein U9M48_007731 [Paspalum notatum var. saurae]|uniref:Uncharacterized protein n=1 Tax=Paspalum notatum var. saurae TaxID=547442 RepID=A0AAQ3SMS6_PASNO
METLPLPLSHGVEGERKTTRARSPRLASPGRAGLGHGAIGFLICFDLAVKLRNPHPIEIVIATRDWVVGSYISSLPGFANACYRAVFIVLSIPPPTCIRDRESRSPKPFAFRASHREKANKVFGKRFARPLAVFTTGRPSSSLAGGYRRRLLHGLRIVSRTSTRDVRDTVIVNVIPDNFPNYQWPCLPMHRNRRSSLGVHFKRWQIKCTLSA